MAEGFNASVEDLTKAMQAGSIMGRTDGSLSDYALSKFESLEISLKYQLYFPSSKDRKGSLKYLQFCKKYKYNFSTKKASLYGQSITPRNWSDDLKLWNSIPKTVI